MNAKYEVMLDGTVLIGGQSFRSNRYSTRLIKRTTQQRSRRVRAEARLADLLDRIDGALSTRSGWKRLPDGYQSHYSNPNLSDDDRVKWLKARREAVLQEIANLQYKLMG